jgi:hypothetical protein
MYYKARKGSFLEQDLRKIFRKDLEREKKFREWCCKNLPPFSDMKLQANKLFLFPDVTEFKLVGEVNTNDWELDNMNNEFYYPDLNSDSGYEIYQHIEWAKGRSFSTNALLYLLGLGEREFDSQPNFFENGSMYLWLPDRVNDEFGERYKGQIWHISAAEYLPMAITAEYGLETSNIKTDNHEGE